MTLPIADVDSDEEDLNENDTIITQQEENSQDEEVECAEDQSPENENRSPTNNGSESTVYQTGMKLLGKIDRRVPMEESAGVTSFESDKGQNNLFLFELMQHWMFLKSCGVTKTFNAFYVTQKMKL